MNSLTRLTQPFGIDLFCLGKKFLVFNLVGRNLKTKYRRSFFGFFWTILTPLATTAVYYFVYRVILNVQIPNYLVFILAGVLHWGFISQTIIEGMDSIVGAAGLITKVPIPLPVFPIVATITNMVTLVLALPVLIGTALLTSAPISWSFVLLPYHLFLLFLMVYGIASVLAILVILLRDLRHIMTIIIQVWFFMTPVIYDEHMIPTQYRWLLYLNPFGIFYTNLHAVLVRGEWPSKLNLTWVSGWACLIVIVTLWVQKSLSQGVVEQI